MDTKEIASLRRRVADLEHELAQKAKMEEALIVELNRVLYNNANLRDRVPDRRGDDGERRIMLNLWQNHYDHMERIERKAKRAGSDFRELVQSDKKLSEARAARTREVRRISQKRRRQRERAWAAD